MDWNICTRLKLVWGGLGVVNVPHHVRHVLPGKIIIVVYCLKLTIQRGLGKGKNSFNGKISWHGRASIQNPSGHQKNCQKMLHRWYRVPLAYSEVPLAYSKVPTSLHWSTIEPTLKYRTIAPTMMYHQAYGEVPSSLQWCTIVPTVKYHPAYGKVAPDFTEVPSAYNQVPVPSVTMKYHQNLLLGMSDQIW